MPALPPSKPAHMRMGESHHHKQAGRQEERACSTFPFSSMSFS